MPSPYADLDRPPLSARALGRALGPDGWRLEVLALTRSTNEVVAARARAGEPAGLVVVAEQQTAGRGRLGRTWTSPPRAGLTLSVLLRPELPPERWPWLPLWGGVAVARALREQCGVDAVLKWPNDVLVGGRKLCGLLAEVPADGTVVLGIGLNVTTRADELPPATGLPATSLQLAGATGTDRDPLLRALLRGLAAWYGGWRESGGDAEMCGLLAAYRRHCATIGRDVRVHLPNGTELAGEVTTVDRDGQLVLRTDDGAEHRVSAGDVLHVR